MPQQPYTDMRYYLEELRQTERVDLTDDEAQALIDSGDTEAVFRSLMKLVPYIVQKHVSDGLRRENYQDMIQEGNIGLLSAVKSWKHGRGMSLSSWAYMYIKRAVTREASRDVAFLQHHDFFDFNEDSSFDESENSDNFRLQQESENPLVDPSDDGEWERAQEWTARFRALRKRFNARDKIILDALLEGRTQEYISRATGISQSRVSRVIQQIQDRMQDFSCA